MEKGTVKIKIRKNGEDEEREADAFLIGDLAVHKKFHDDIEYDSWCITSCAQGMKFPGETYGFKAAIECAKELDAMDVKWADYTKDKYPEAGKQAREILAEWGVMEVNRFLD